MLEEFQCNWFYLAGKLNVLADAFSRLPRFDFSGAEERKDDLSMQKVSFDPDAPVQLGASMFSSDPYLGLADDDLSRSLSFFVEADGDQATYMNVPSTTQNPLRYQWILESQNADHHLLQCLIDNPTHFRRRQFGREDIELIFSIQKQMMIQRTRLLSRMMQRMPQLNSFICCSTILGPQLSSSHCICFITLNSRSKSTLTTVTSARK